MAIGVGGGGEHRVSKWDGREADEGGRVAEVHGGVVGREEGGGREGLITEFELVGEFFAPMTVIESH